MSIITKNLGKTLKKLITKKEVKYDLKELILPLNYYKNELTLKSLLIPEKLKNDRLDSKFDNFSKLIIDNKLMGSIPIEYQNKILAQIKLPIKIDHTPNDKESKWLILDKLSDPVNLGKLIHSAKLLGWDHVFIVKGSCDPLSLKSIESSKGAVLDFNWSIINYEELLGKAKDLGFNLVLSEMPPPNSIKFNEPILFNRKILKTIENYQNLDKLALVLGSEHHGISNNINSDLGLGIPINNKLESLNVTSAGVILMDYLNQKTKSYL